MPWRARSATHSIGWARRPSRACPAFKLSQRTAELLRHSRNVNDFALRMWTRTGLSSDLSRPGRWWLIDCPCCWVQENRHAPQANYGLSRPFSDAPSQLQFTRHERHATARSEGTVVFAFEMTVPSFRGLVTYRTAEIF
jgi:hypothetical protein